jgi:hypothetical protein
MEAARAAIANAGARISPLRHIGDVATFVFAVAAIAPGVKDRAARIAARMGGALSGTAVQIGELLAAVSEEKVVRELVAVIPASEGMELATDRTTCIVCNAPLVSSDSSFSIPLFSATGVKTVSMCSKSCTRCKARHYLSYATGGDRLNMSEQHPYPGSTDARFYHSTCSALWETTVLVKFETQAMFSHTGFETFLSEYTFMHPGLPFSSIRANQAFAHAFYAWTFLRFRAEFDLPLHPCKLGDDVARGGELSALGQTLLAGRDELNAAFTGHWGQRHHLVCRDPEGACVVHATDGHMKARRVVCENRWARLVDCGPLGILTLNCSHMPLRGSRFCGVCRDAAAHSGPEGLVGSAGLSTGAGCAPCDPCDADEDEAPTVAAAYRESRAADRGWEVSTKEKDVFLVESILEHKPATIQGQCAPTCSLGDGHRQCIKKHRRRMFLVKWVGYDESLNRWVCEHDVSVGAITEYDEERKAKAAGRHRPQSHAGTLAAACRAAAGGGTLDFVVTDADRKAFEEIKSCRNLKEFQYAEKKHTTAGILALVSGCGLFLKLDEIFGAESLTQLNFFLFEAYHKDGIVKPKVLVYDDACHLLKFLRNRPNSLLCRTLLRGMAIVCDRFHFPNHKDPWCKANVDPGKCTVPGFSKANTQAGEEAFSWMARSKHIFRNMNEAHFLFFMLRLVHLRNKYLCTMKLNAR